MYNTLFLSLLTLGFGSACSDGAELRSSSNAVQQSNLEDNGEQIPEIPAEEPAEEPEEKPGYLHYRFVITKAKVTGTWVAMRYLNFDLGNGPTVSTINTDDKSKGFIAGYEVEFSASSIMDNDLVAHSPGMAFLNSGRTTPWISGRNTYDSASGLPRGEASWIQVSFDDKAEIKGMKVFGYSENEYPQSWRLEGSNDNENWTTIPGSEQSDINTAGSSDGYSYSF